MKREEFIERFVQLCCSGERNNYSGDLLLSDNRVLGIPMMKDAKERFLSLGYFKLKKGKRPLTRVRVIVNLLLDLRFLYSAMRVLRRRRVFELGIFSLYDGWVFGVREGENIILVAPAVSDEEVRKRYPSLADVVTNRDTKSRLQKWETWARILYGNKLWGN